MAGEIKQKIDPETLAIIAELARQNQSGLIEAIKELKKPDEETVQKKKEAEDARQAELKSYLDAQVAKAEGTWAIMQSCQHKKGNGMHTWSGQVLSGNNDAIAQCSRCQIDFRWEATSDQLSSGLRLDEMMGLTAEHLASWENVRPPKIRAKRHFWRELAEMKAKR